MATVIRNTDPAIAAFVSAHNAVKTQIGAGSKQHLDVSEVTVTAADGNGTLPVALALVNQIKAVFDFHRSDTLIHKVADATNAETAPVATDLASAETLANDLYTQYNAHIADTTHGHFNADITNAASSASASSQGTLDTRITDLKAKLNAHMGTGSAPTSVAASLRLVNG